MDSEKYIFPQKAWFIWEIVVYCGKYDISNWKVQMWLQEWWMSVL